MAETKGKKKRLSINLSFLTLSDFTKRTSAHKSAKIFEQPNGVVGLGILAALNEHHHHHHHQDPVFINGCRTAVLAVSPKPSSKPISILSNKSFSKSSNTSHEYTRNFFKKKDYFEADFSGNNNGSLFEVADFLNSCFLCDKLLHGLDIFMYRGDKAFCSAECRLRQISMDEQKDQKCHSAVRKPMEYSVSPLHFLVGVAAA